mmetsp:Transcript_7724/g.11103  ORF Transcript_7724/g.11103 Transcript_7724/m.11103 type:complete len:255 (-) Transcript_7724:316-1080(-)
MAAVLCRGLGQLCAGLGDVVCLPCKACGVGCEALWDTVKSPFFPYLAITVGLNLPPIFMGLRAIPSIGGGCDDGVQWLLVNMVLALVHIIAAFYLARKISEQDSYAATTTTSTMSTAANNSSIPQASAVVYGDKDEKVESGTYYAANNNNVPPPTTTTTSVANQEYKGPHDTMGRVRHLLCEDKWMALYILIGIGWFVWQAMGAQRFFDADDNADGACGSIRALISTSLVCGWLYVSLAGIAFVLSICCLGFRS